MYDDSSIEIISSSCYNRIDGSKKFYACNLLFPKDARFQEITNPQALKRFDNIFANRAKKIEDLRKD
jgi:hypothetical protein